MTTAYALVSGGLDSGLAALSIARQNIKTICIIFESLFFNAEAGKKLCKHIGLEYRVIDFTAEHLKIVKNPPQGYGKNMNPCIDCHALMLKLACELLDLEKNDFIVTGEVLNQRPMSQNRISLEKVARGCPCSSRILRPLSARLLEPTIMETQKIVNRELLHDIEGRSRQKQLILAKEYNLIEFPGPAGGCTLTDPGFSLKLKDLFDHKPDCSPSDIKQLFHGRHIRTALNSKLIIARDAMECEKLENQLFNKGDLLLTPFEFSGPSALIPGVMATEIPGVMTPQIPEVLASDTDVETKNQVIQNKLLRDQIITESIRIFARYLKKETTHVEASVKTSNTTEVFKKIPVTQRAAPEELHKLLIAK